MEPLLLSHPLDALTPLYGGGRGIEIVPEKQIARGDSCNTFRVAFNNHTSTHIDMPYHFISGGKRLTDVSAGFWVFRKVVLIEYPARAGELIDFNPADFVTGNTLESAEIILLRTGYEKFRGEQAYWAESPGLAPALAERLKLAMPKLRAVGVDCISVSSLKHRSEGRQAHREFLGREIALIEDMKLSGLAAAPEQLVVSPLLITGIDGSPVTVFAFVNLPGLFAASDGQYRA